MTVLVAAAALVAIWFVARRVGRGRPCPVRVAALLDNRAAGWLGGTTAVIERAGVREGMRVLDAGCGPGRLTIPLARRVGPEGEVVALDLQPGMLDRVAANAARAGVTNIRPVLGALGGDGAALRPFERLFDRILLVTVLGEIPDQSGAMRSLYGALKPGGVLSVTEMIIDPDYVPRRRVERLAADAGFRAAGAAGSVLMFTMNFTRPAA
jgi:ubiquinone/menaquinone biosynthesis C-methylase UbiE